MSEQAGRAPDADGSVSGNYPLGDRSASSGRPLAEIGPHGVESSALSNGATSSEGGAASDPAGGRDRFPAVQTSAGSDDAAPGGSGSTVPLGRDGGGGSIEGALEAMGVVAVSSTDVERSVQQLVERQEEERLRTAASRKRRGRPDSGAAAVADAAAVGAEKIDETRKRSRVVDDSPAAGPPKKVLIPRKGGGPGAEPAPASAASSSASNEAQATAAADRESLLTTGEITPFVGRNEERLFHRVVVHHHTASAAVAVAAAGAEPPKATVSRSPAEEKSTSSRPPERKGEVIVISSSDSDQDMAPPPPRARAGTLATRGDDSEKSEEVESEEDDEDEDEWQPTSRRTKKRQRPKRAPRPAKEPPIEVASSGDDEPQDDAEDEEEWNDEDEDDAEEADAGEDDDGGNSSNDDQDRLPKKGGLNVYTDDADEAVFQARLARARAAEARRRRAVPPPGGAAAAARPDDDEEVDVVFDGGYVIPGRVWDGLFQYQRTSIKWQWELHCQNTGGIIADEMGLGKTVQTVAFVGGLHYSGTPAADESRAAAGVALTRPLRFRAALVVCPATVMLQWMREFHLWYPELRVMLLHESGNHAASYQDVVRTVFTAGHVLITTYSTLRLQHELLLDKEWSLVVLDEGHKIRNPAADITAVCKMLRSVHRLVLTGSPIQNNLTELWSLFDFIFPGKLGTLPVFEEEFCVPITQGGYVSASKEMVQMAFRCATVLRDLVSPYILLRTKASVARHLPAKTEHVLFCTLSRAQREAYRLYLRSEEVSSIWQHRTLLFRAISVLRKICNHPDLMLLGGGAQSRRPPGMPDFGAPERSGKLLVVRQILPLWKQEGHRCLLFTQTRQMLDVVESMVRTEGYKYRRLDGNTSIARRLPLVDEFNEDPTIFLMLLTTKAGGLGVNLVGADRIIVFDPDWNPATDSQAKERAYRIGQVRDVTVYRLVTRGTIEEKVYQRQIFKSFLTAKVLQDPRQKRFFHPSEMRDLLSLADDNEDETETAGIFRDAAHQIAPASGADGLAGREGAGAGVAGTSKGQTDASLSSGSQVYSSSAAASSAAKAAGPATKAAAPGTRETPPSTEDGGGRSGAHQDTNGQTGAGADPVLAMLLSRGDGAVDSALSHDRVMASHLPGQDAMRKNAERIAQRALAALRQSRAQVPYYGGASGARPASSAAGRFGQQVRVQGPVGDRSVSQQHHGVAAADGALPGSSRRAVAFGSDESSFPGIAGVMAGNPGTVASAQTGAPAPPSSSALLAHMRQRQEATSSVGAVALEERLAAAERPAARQEPDDASGADADEADMPASGYSAAHQKLLRDLRAYLERRMPEGVHSRVLADAFSHRLKGKEDRLVFRYMLQQLARLDKKQHRWFLRDA